MNRIGRGVRSESSAGSRYSAAGLAAPAIAEPIRRRGLPGLFGDQDADAPAIAGFQTGPAVGEALSFLDQSLDAGFRPGMGNVVPDRFFWALPPAEGEGDESGGGGEEASDPDVTPRQVH